MTQTITDILPTLPHEIHDQIFQYLTENEIWRLARVCQSWRSMSLHWQPRWECLSTTRDGRHSIIPDMVPYTSYIEKGSVKQIRVHTDDIWQLFQVVSFIKNQAFCAISKLDLFVEYFTTSDLQAFVSTCGESLKEIIIKGLDTHEANVRPDTLLIACPNLVKLHFRGLIHEGDDGWKPDFGTTKCNALTDLTLDISNEEDIFRFNPRAFLQASPNLQYLGMRAEHLVTVCNDLPIWIQEYCPDLTTLYLDCYELENDNDEVLHIASKFKNCDSRLSPLTSLSSPGSKKHHQHRKGLQHISIHEYDSNEHRNRSMQCIVAPFLKTDQSQLVSLDVGGNATVCGIILRLLASKSWPSLKGLRLTDYNGGDHDGHLSSPLLASLLQSSVVPNLTYLSLCFQQIVDKEVFDAIASNLCHLEELVLYPDDLEDSGLLEFLRQFEKKKKPKHHLRSLTLNASSTSEATGLMDILGSEQVFLEHLDQLTVVGIIYTLHGGFSGIHRFLDARLSAINNNKCKKLQKLNFSFQPDWGLLRNEVDIPTDTHVKKVLAKMDQTSIAWTYSVGLLEHQVIDGNSDCIFEQENHARYRSRQKKGEEYDYTSNIQFIIV